jgi:hypothetical protein
MNQFSHEKATATLMNLQRQLPLIQNLHIQFLATTKQHLVIKIYH